MVLAEGKPGWSLSRVGRWVIVWPRYWGWFLPKMEGILARVEVGGELVKRELWGSLSASFSACFLPASVGTKVWLLSWWVFFFFLFLIQAGSFDDLFISLSPPHTAHTQNTLRFIPIWFQSWVLPHPRFFQTVLPTFHTGSWIIRLYQNKHTLLSFLWSTLSIWDNFFAEEDAILYLEI